MNCNVILVLDREQRNILMCKRKKPPYQGHYNLVGGKIEPGEDGYHAAYRELWEETAIGRDAIQLFHMMTLSYPKEGTVLEVYAGTLLQDVDIHGEENPLQWITVDENFMDTTRFAGRGNIAHMLAYYWEVVESEKEQRLK